ncbi:MAG TPA: hypothetical protein DD422_06430 [Akkermansia sp.]|nr:hypothetical protein [Akkermansia sp.]HBN17670.1 hypothetical protein [Akkermansia sp.]
MSIPLSCQPLFPIPQKCRSAEKTGRKLLSTEIGRAAINTLLFPASLQNRFHSDGIPGRLHLPLHEWLAPTENRRSFRSSSCRRIRRETPVERICREKGYLVRQLGNRVFGEPAST